FHMPKLVYMNIAALSTLPKREFNCGLGEIIKHGLIKDISYLEFIDLNKEKIADRDTDTLTELIYRSCQIKSGVVERDPKEKGERALLNFGHTLGHAIEKKMDFSMLHGECVALGSMAALFISMQMGIITKEEYEKACALFHWFDYPALPKETDPKEIVAITKLDKKMEQGKVKFIVLERIGEAKIVKTVTDSMMEEALRTIMA
ncbi:MAG: 3-dehydroquinate synthase family protein, partial [Lachnospiraceae bacterium]|nr:3-dehydroquinate synthase family protein [Lachnospiraceae bacterium]